MFENINFIAVWIAAFLALGFTTIWNNSIFWKKWIEYSGTNPDEFERKQGWLIAQKAVVNLIWISVLAFLLKINFINDAISAMEFAYLIWLSCALPLGFSLNILRNGSFFALWIELLWFLWEYIIAATVLGYMS